MSEKFKCPACHGEGKYPKTEYGHIEFCGFCEGTGLVDKGWYYITMGYLSSMERVKKDHDRKQANLPKSI